MWVMALTLTSQLRGTVRWQSRRLPSSTPRSTSASQQRCSRMLCHGVDPCSSQPVIMMLCWASGCCPTGVMASLPVHVVANTLCGTARCRPVPGRSRRQSIVMPALPPQPRESNWNHGRWCKAGAGSGKRPRGPSFQSYLPHHVVLLMLHISLCPRLSRASLRGPCAGRSLTASSVCLSQQRVQPPAMFMCISLMEVVS